MFFTIWRLINILLHNFCIRKDIKTKIRNRPEMCEKEISLFWRLWDPQKFHSGKMRGRKCLGPREEWRGSKEPSARPQPVTHRRKMGAQRIHEQLDQILHRARESQRVHRPILSKRRWLRRPKLGAGGPRVSEGSIQPPGHCNSCPLGNQVSTFFFPKQRSCIGLMKPNLLPSEKKKKKTWEILNCEALVSEESASRRGDSPRMAGAGSHKSRSTHAPGGPSP